MFEFKILYQKDTHLFLKKKRYAMMVAILKTNLKPVYRSKKDDGKMIMYFKQI